MKGFYGYGDLTAHYWFIGVEEAGWANQKEAKNRLSAWDHLGRRSIVDLFEFHKAAKIVNRHGPKTELQKTWNGLIRLILAGQGQSPSNKEIILRYQNDVLGRTGNETCLLDLFLPRCLSKNIQRPDMTEITNKRIHWIKEAIEKHRPWVVVFYSVRQRFKTEYWPRISQIPIEMYKEKLSGTWVATNRNTIFAIIHHPAQNMSNQKLESIGKLIFAQLNSSGKARLESDRRSTVCG